MKLCRENSTTYIVPVFRLRGTIVFCTFSTAMISLYATMPWTSKKAVSSGSQYESSLSTTLSWISSIIHFQRGMQHAVKICNRTPQPLDMNGPTHDYFCRSSLPACLTISISFPSEKLNSVLSFSSLLENSTSLKQAPGCKCSQDKHHFYEALAQERLTCCNDNCASHFLIAGSFTHANPTTMDHLQLCVRKSLPRTYS